MWGKGLPNRFGVRYVPNSESTSNQFARSMKRGMNELEKQDPKILNDYLAALNGAKYIPNFFENTTERTIFNKLKSEIDVGGAVAWSKHFKIENPEKYTTVNEIINKMKEHFNVEILHTRINYYPDETSFKPLHKDQNAYSDDKGDFTMGASFGDTRSLEFVHDVSKLKFEFPQNNGDIFAFNDTVNKQFMHGVPKIRKKVGERFSIIAWGKLL